MCSQADRTTSDRQTEWNFKMIQQKVSCKSSWAS